VQNPVFVSALDRPAFDRTQLCFLEGLSNALDRQSVFFRLSVCLLTDRLSNDYVLNSLPIFTKFCMRLIKCGRIVAYCLWDKPEVVCRF